MVKIPVERNLRERFQGRRQYMSSRAHGTPTPELCKVLERTWPTLGPDPGSDAPAWTGFPWLTLVVGSGCLDLPDDPALDPARYEAEVSRIIAELVEDERDDRDERLAGADERAGVAEAGRAGAFARSLVVDRVQPVPRRGAPPPGFEAPRVDPIAARLTLLAYLLTRFFHEASRLDPKPLSRWDHDHAAVPHRSSLGDDAIVIDGLLELARYHSDRAIASLRDVTAGPLVPDVRNAVETLLTEVNQGLVMHRRLELTHLRLVTEVAWFLLTMEAGVYPGWTDLLLELMLRDNGARHAGSGFRRSRPSYENLRHHADILPTLLLPATEASWARSSTETQRNRFYEAAAETLWAQAAAAGMSSTRLPPASAFVTSFDLELEMALWRAAPADSSFFVVLPVHVFERPNDASAHPCWLRGEIRPGSGSGGLGEVRAPVRWQVLTSTTKREEFLRGPHIVRLSGSPLVRLPGSAPVADAEAEASRLADRRRICEQLVAVGVRNIEAESVELEHAVTVDEYLAMRQSEAELLLAVGEGEDAQNKTNRGLPAYLHSSSMTPDSGTNPRFWLAVGVPVGDPAVRLRLMSQITAKKLRDRVGVLGGAADPAGGAAAAPGTVGSRIGGLFPAKQEPPPPPPTSAPGGDPGPVAPAADGPFEGSLTGVVVNRRITEDEAELLYWIGFDVVSDDADSFTPDLRHYARHVRAGGRGTQRWTSATLSCPLVDGAV